MLVAGWQRESRVEGALLSRPEYVSCAWCSSFLKGNGALLRSDWKVHSTLDEVSRERKGGWKKLLLLQVLWSARKTDLHRKAIENYTEIWTCSFNSEYPVLQEERFLGALHQTSLYFHTAVFLPSNFSPFFVFGYRCVLKPKWKPCCFAPLQSNQRMTEKLPHKIFFPAVTIC